jgi:pimeloyl-ACP methyl ester carboxylesterase
MLKEQAFHTGTITINYAEGPSTGFPVVLLHGGSSRWQGASAIIPALAERWHVYAPDFRGHGKSSWVPGHYRLKDYVADTTAFLEHCVREPAVLFGHSLGAQVALMVAARRPQLVRAVIAGDTPFSLANLRDHIYRNRPMTARWQELAGSGRPVEDIAARVRDMRLPVPGKDTSERLGDVFGEENPWFSFMAETLNQHDPSMLTTVLDDFDATHEGFDTDTLFPLISCPVLILQGDPAYGGLLTDEEIERALPLLAHATVARFERLGHELHTREPELVLRAVIPFLETL